MACPQLYRHECTWRPRAWQLLMKRAKNITTKTAESSYVLSEIQLYHTTLALVQHPDLSTSYLATTTNPNHRKTRFSTEPRRWSPAEVRQVWLGIVPFLLMRLMLIQEFVHHAVTRLQHNNVYTCVTVPIGSGERELVRILQYGNKEGGREIGIVLYQLI